MSREACKKGFVSLKESVYLSLKSYKPTVFKYLRDNTPRSTIKVDFAYTTKISKTRRKSCYCSECGKQSKFQFKQQDVPLIKLKRKFACKRQQITISQTQSSVNADEYSPQYEESPGLKKSSLLSSRRLSRQVHHSRFRQSILLTNSEEKLQMIQEQKFKKSSFFGLDQITNFRIFSKPQSPVRKISQPLYNFEQSQKSITQRSPIQNEKQFQSNKKYQNIYLMPLTNRNSNKAKQEKQQQQFIKKNKSTPRKRNCFSQI